MEVTEDAGNIPQSEPLSENMVQNNAGGFVYKVDDMNRVRRFLCFGSEGGTYYVTEPKLGIQNAQCVQRLIEAGKGTEVVKEVVNFSVEGRSAKQNPIIFVLAMCARQEKDKEAKKLAYDSLAKVCRIPTHLFSFVTFCELLSRGTGWGRAHRRAVCDWYLRYGDNPMQLAMHVTKYKSRNGWSHTDVLRLAHPKPEKEGVAAVLKYVVKGLDVAKEHFLKDTKDVNEDLKKLFDFFQAVEEIKVKKEIDEVVRLVREYKLVREHIPTEMLNEKPVWKALLEKMPMTAMIRNLSKMTAIELLHEGSAEAQHVIEKLSDTEALRSARIHPFNVLLALYTYNKGHGDKGSLTWTPNQSIVRALDNAFYKSFKFVEPTNRRYLLAVDVSGSMTCGGVISSTVVSPREASAALSMVTLRTEERCDLVGFSYNLVPMEITREMNLTQVIDKTNRMSMGSTDCAQPMIWAKAENKLYDVFIVYTDCETWAGAIHPREALRQYREHSGIKNAKLIVCAMTSNGFTLADPDDPGMLDMAGFDASGPEVMRNFVMDLL